MWLWLFSLPAWNQVLIETHEWGIVDLWGDGVWLGAVVVYGGADELDHGGDVFTPGTEHWYQADGVELGALLSDVEVLQLSDRGVFDADDGAAQVERVQASATLRLHQQSVLSEADWSPGARIRGPLFGSTAIHDAGVALSLVVDADAGWSGIDWFCGDGTFAELFAGGLGAGEVVELSRWDPSDVEPGWQSFTGVW